MTEPWWISLIEALVIVNLVMGAFAYTTWLERKLLGRMQLRYGPNRAGPVRAAAADRRPGQARPQGGLLPRLGSHELPYILAPILSCATALAGVRGDPLGARAGRSTATTSRAQIANVPISLILIFALGSIGIYGFIVGGWASDSKFSMLGSMRTCAQLVSYEVSLALSVLGVVMMGRSLNLVDIVDRQGVDALVLHPAVRRARASSCSPGSPRPRARRSTSPRPTPSSSPGTTPSTRACAGASSRRPSTST